MIASIELFEALKTKFGESEAKVIVKEIEKIESSVDAKVEREFDRKSQIFKDDIKSLKDYMDKVFTTKEDLAKQKAEIIKWMFIFWISQLASFIAIVKFLLPKN